jgi:ATP-binding cassette subfamily B (MDR/TAP) protein 1
MWFLRESFFFYPTRPEQQVFVDFSLTIKAITTVALVGPSGTGKSTAIALLEPFYDPQQGSISLDGNKLRDLNVQLNRNCFPCQLERI